MNRYYLTQRGPSLGTQPLGVINIVDFGTKQFVEEVNCKCWGYIDYLEPLTAKQIEDYELVEATK